jgi:hypothetical protein
MPKTGAIDPNAASRIASNHGRNGPFNKVQDEVIKPHLADWHEFAFVKNPNAGGRGLTGKLTKWKQERAKEIMKDTAFKEYPPGVGSFQSAESTN